MNVAKGKIHYGVGKDDTLKNKRLMEIRKAYDDYKLTPRQQRENQKEAGKEMLQMMRQKGTSESAIAYLATHLGQIDLIVDSMPDEVPRDKIVSQTFNYNNGREISEVTITSEGSRHWRKATTEDYGSIVYLHNDNEFGEFDDICEEPDEEFPEETHTEAIVYTFSGRMQTPHAFDSTFEDLLVVPEEVLNGVKNEAPSGRFFSGKSITSLNQRFNWSPAPDGMTWMQHPYLKDPNGTYLPDELACCTKLLIELPRMKTEVREKSWKERDSLKYWCPVLKQFLSEGGRLRQEHWFHNGDGSVHQRYFYNQHEMLDMHGGLMCLPVTTGSEEDDVCFTGVVGFEDVIAKKRKDAEAKGEIIEIDMDGIESKTIAKKHRRKQSHAC